MQKITGYFSLSILAFASAATSFAGQSKPLVTIDIKNYETLLADASSLMAASGQDASIVQMQMQEMLGGRSFGLIDSSEPWHVAVWLESLGQPPIIAIVLPIADFEAFQVAVHTSMVGQLGAQYLDVGDRVVLYGSTPGSMLPEGCNARIKTYAAGLALAPEETIEISLDLDEEIRAAAVAGLAISKAQILATFNQSGVDTAGMPPETMQGMMEAYFSFYELILMETKGVEFGMNVGGGDLSFSVDIMPVAGSGFADFVASQNIDITDLAASVDWSSDMAVIVGMGDWPEAWQPMIDSAMQSLMPLYGLGDEVAAAWTDTMQATLPFKGVYHINFQDGVTFSGFYDILDAPVAEIYEKWLTITEEAGFAEDAAMSYYSEIKIEKAFRTLNGHSVDRIEMTVNLEHPSMQLPEQKAVMEQLFDNGKVVYEMALVGNRIYMVTEGELARAFESEGRGSSLVEINSNTRFVGTMDVASIFRLGAILSSEPAPTVFDRADNAQITYAIEVNDGLTFKAATPLSIIEAFKRLYL